MPETDDALQAICSTGNIGPVLESNRDEVIKTAGVESAEESHSSKVGTFVPPNLGPNLASRARIWSKVRSRALHKLLNRLRLEDPTMQRS
jgi:hypothetical protein